MSVYNNNKNLIIIIMLIMTNGGAIKFQLAKMRKHMCFTVYNQESATSVLLILTRWFYNKSQTKKKKQNHSSIGVLFTGLGLLRLRFLKCVFHRFCFFFFKFWYDDGDPPFHIGIPQAPMLLSHALKHGRTLWQMSQTASTSRNLSCHVCCSKPPMWLQLRGPERRSALDVEKNSPCVWLWFLSSLILSTVRLLRLTGWHIFSQPECNDIY